MLTLSMSDTSGTINAININQGSLYNSGVTTTYQIRPKYIMSVSFGSAYILGTTEFIDGLTKHWSFFSTYPLPDYFVPNDPATLTLSVDDASITSVSDTSLFTRSAHTNYLEL